jgi:ketosteroid isomerase-like protein
VWFVFFVTELFVSGIRAQKKKSSLRFRGDFPQRRESMMKRSLAIVTLVIVALAAPVQMLAQQNSKAEKEVRTVLDGARKAVLKGGVEAAVYFDKYNADDFTLIGPNGAVQTKAENLEGWRSGKTGYQKMDFSDVKVRIYGNTAVVTGIVKFLGEQAGVKYNDNQYRFTRVFVRQGGIWKHVLLQNTRITQQ